MAYSDVITKLNQDSSCQAEKWLNEKSAINLFSIFVKMKLIFLKAYIWEGRIRNGVLGFITSYNQALLPLLSYAKSWELKERKRGRI